MLGYVLLLVIIIIESLLLILIALNNGEYKDNIKSEFDDKLTSLRDSLDQKVLEINDLHRQNDSNTESINKYKEEISSLEFKKELLTNENSRLKKTIDTDEYHTELIDENTKLYAKISNLNNELSILRNVTIIGAEVIHCSENDFKYDIKQSAEDHSIYKLISLKELSNRDRLVTFNGKIYFVDTNDNTFLDNNTAKKRIKDLIRTKAFYIRFDDFKNYIKSIRIYPTILYDYGYSKLSDEDWIECRFINFKENDTNINIRPLNRTKGISRINVVIDPSVDTRDDIARLRFYETPDLDSKVLATSGDPESLINLKNEVYEEYNQTLNNDLKLLNTNEGDYNE